MSAVRKAPVRVWENLFLRTTLIVGVVMVLAVGGLTYWLRFPIESMVRKEAVRDVESHVYPIMLGMLTPQDFEQPLTGARYDRLSNLLAQYVVGPDILRLKLWNSKGTVVYSTLATQVGDSYPKDTHLVEALGGESVSNVTHESESALERGLGEMIEVYVPLAWDQDAAPIGVAEIYTSYAPYAALVASQRNAVFLAGGVIFVVLVCALYLLYRSGWGSIRRERDMAIQRRREVEALNRLLQQDLAHGVELRDRLISLRNEVADIPISGVDGATLAARYARLGVRLGEITAFADDPLSASAHAQSNGKNRGVPGSEDGVPDNRYGQGSGAGA